MHQGEGRIVTHNESIDIGHRQRKAGALQQSAEIAQIGERRDAGRYSGLDLGLGGGKGLPQLGERLPAEKRGEKKPVRLERAADLDERARQVVDDMEREQGDDEIERSVAKRQSLLVGDDFSIIRGTGRQRLDSDDGAGLPLQCLPRGITRRAKIECQVEAAQDRGQAVGQIIRRAVEQECRRPERLCTPPAGAQEQTIEDGGRRHRALIAREARAVKATRIECERLERYACAMPQAAIEQSTSRPARFAAGLRKALGIGVDLALPPLCPSCREPVGDMALCAACWAKLSFIAPPYCARLGVPFGYDPGPGVLSMQAIADPPAFNRARAAVRYDDVARTLVHALKYGDRLDLAPTMGQWTAAAGRELLADADALIPVPLHWRRLWARRFNQAAALAQSIARATGVRVLDGSLKRVKATAQQVGLSKAERAVNVQGAFRVS
jgi:predicted amidophosphoribosyltransferase